MAIFNSYVKLPEGSQCVARRKKVSGTKTKISPEVVETIHRALQPMVVKW